VGPVHQTASEGGPYSVGTRVIGRQEHPLASSRGLAWARGGQAAGRKARTKSWGPQARRAEPYQVAPWFLFQVDACGPPMRLSFFQLILNFLRSF
jgi:hypothetical protein